MTEGRSYKNSISKQFACVFIIVMAMTLFFCWLANNLFLEKYYLREKEQVLADAYSILETADSAGQLSDDEFGDKLRSLCDRYSMDVLVMDADSKTIEYMGEDSDIMTLYLWNHLFSDENTTSMMPDVTVLKSDDNYELSIIKDPVSNSEYLDIWGNLSSGNLFIIRTALESIKDSVSIANRFLGYVGAIGIIISAILIFFASKAIAKPILTLADISRRMINLDFDAKYEGRDDNEISFLGDNINKLSETLESTISELKSANLELQKDIDKKTEIDEMRKEFLSNVSHELKTPIALIQGYAEGLVEGIADDPESMQYYIEVIHDEADKMNNMVKKLLTLNQLEFGNEMVTMERFDIVALIRTLVTTSEILTKDSGISISIPDSDPIYVWGDEFLVEEILSNYITNALNHCAYDKKIDITIEETEKVRIKVFNTGDPIPEESVDHIWEKFYKVDKARTRAYGGSGVGLSIVAAICDSLNQKYGVINYDNGVCFWFELDRQ